MKQRFITAVAMMAIFIPLLVVPKMFWGFQVLMMILVAVASSELLKCYETETKFPGGVKAITIFLTELVYLSSIADWSPKSLSSDGLKLFNINIGFFSMLIVAILILFSLMVLYEDYNGNMIGKSLTTILYCGVGFGALTILRFVGLRIIAYLFIITIFTDVFAYLFGRKIGKHKMCPKISPKKSWEGAIAGTIIATTCASLFAIFYGKMFNYSDTPTVFHNLTNFINFDSISKAAQVILIICITFFASIMGQIGDLVASKFKRTTGIKDFGNIFPGHGGVLDRLDSALFAAIFLFAILSLITNFLY